MNFRIKGKNFHVGKSLQEYVEKKLERINRHFDDVIECDVELTTEKNPSIKKNQHAEFTLNTKGATIRAESSTEDMFKSIDEAIDKLDRQIFSYKGKLYLNKNSHRKEAAAKASIKMSPMSNIIKRKRVTLKPMSQEEAALQIDLLNHIFYVFRNSDTDEVNVLYKRRDENYVLIEPT